MPVARKYTSNDALTAHESRKKAIAAIQILWKQMRPDLFDKDELRDERLTWISGFLKLPRPLESITELSDGQMMIVLDEMRGLTGTKQQQPTPWRENARIEREHHRHFQSIENVVSIEQFKRQHFASQEQKFTLDKIIKHLGWSDGAVKDFLVRRGFGESIEKIAFKKANSLTMILLNIAADKDLRAQGKTKISRAMTAKHISVIKRRLEIDR